MKNNKKSKKKKKLNVKRLRSIINIVALSLLTLFAAGLWTLNLLGNEVQRQMIELIFMFVFIPVSLFYLKFWTCTERKRVKALRQKCNNYKKKKKLIQP